MGCAGPVICSRALQMKILVALIFGALSVGCIDGSNDLASLRDPSVVINGIVGQARPNYFEVRIDTPV